MPWTIYKYILIEVLKTLVPSVLVLLTVISFAASVGPLSRGFINAESVPIFVFYMAPSMLQFALPFSAAFAGTIVFNRLANDNEILACRACGISYAKIMMPVVFLGLVLTIGMVFLSNWIVPEFILRAEKMATRDITMSLVNTIKQGREFVIDDKFALYAKNAVIEDSPESSPTQEEIRPSQLIKLQDLVFGQMDDEGELYQYGTAEQADFYVYRAPEEAWLMMFFKGVSVEDQDSGKMRFEEGKNFRVQLKNFFKDQLRFLTIDQIRQMGEEPEKYDRVRKRKHALAQAASRQRVFQMMQREMDAGNAAELLMPDQVGKCVIKNGRIISEDEFGLKIVGHEDKPLVVAFTLKDLPLKTYTTNKAVYLNVDYKDSKKFLAALTDDDFEPRISLAFEDVHVSAVVENSLKSYVENGLRLSEPIYSHYYDELDVKQLIQHVKMEFPGAKGVDDSVMNLDNLLTTMYRRVNGELNLRMANAFSCALILLLGCVLCIRGEGQMPLVIYLKTFVLALVVLILTHRGLKMSIDPKASSVMPGLFLLWAGNTLLLILISFNYWKISRN